VHDVAAPDAGTAGRAIVATIASAAIAACDRIRLSAMCLEAKQVGVPSQGVLRKNLELDKLGTNGWCTFVGETVYLHYVPHGTMPTRHI
jgi:hypothetical protein